MPSLSSESFAYVSLVILSESSQSGYYYHSNFGMSKDEGFPGGSVVTVSAFQCEDEGFDPGVRKMLLESENLFRAEENSWTEDPVAPTMASRESDTTQQR